MLREERERVLAAVQPEMESLLAGHGFELVALRYGGYKNSRTLTAYVDKPGGVTAQDCQEMGYRLGVLMDVIDPIPCSYQLIVSSPGLDRPLTKPEHFQRFAGRQAAVTLGEAARGGRHVRGRLLGFADGQVRLERQGEEVCVPWLEIEEAHLVYDWDEMGGERPEDAA
jgi:ribosome maturation factor RimP